MSETFNLERFLGAQAIVYAEVLEELRAGKKQTHWMWFIFPQMKGLGHSPQSEFFGIGSLQEAAAYSQHPVLGPRLQECTRIVNQLEKRTIQQILDPPDDLKFRSSMTLFSRAAADPSAFNHALEKYFAGHPDPQTLELLH
ncbi:MAG: DUF1810 domain-containing protein [Terracidiphilus sp.]